MRRTTICREGWYYLLVLALAFGGAMLREVNLLLVLAGMLLGPLLFHWRAVVVTLRRLEVRRRLPQQVCAGDLLVGSVMVSNTRPRLGSWAVVVEDEIRPDRADGRDGREGPVRPSVLFPYVAAGESCAGAYRGRLARRGRYRVGPLRVSTRFPFGLISRTVTAGQVETLMVFPRLGRLTRRWAALRREAFAAARRREERPGAEGDFYGLRPWRSGDSRRWIDWRSTARTGTLMVRQFEQPRNREVAVVLDLWQPPRPAPEHRGHVELAVSFAATLLADLCRKGGSTLHLVVVAQPSRLQQPPSLPNAAGRRDARTTSQRDAGAATQCLSGPAAAAVLHDMMHCLATAEAASDDRRADLLECVAGKTGPGAEIVLVSTRPIDLNDSRLWPDPARGAIAPRIRVVDTSSADLAHYFEAKPRQSEI